MEEGSGDNWSYKSCKAQVKSSPTNQHPVLQARCPSRHPANSVKALKGIRRKKEYMFFYVQISLFSFYIRRKSTRNIK